jgi:hypothetical protein
MLLASLLVDAFSPLKSVMSVKKQLQMNILSDMETKSFLVSLLQQVDKSQANAEFYFFFFGGSGALGIGGAQIPKLLKAYSEMKSKAGSSITLGGEELGANPLATFAYPESIKLKDVEKIIKDFPTMAKIQSLAQTKSYMSQLGYLEREAFDKSLPNCNPVAKYVVFDAASGGGGDMVAPQTMEEKLVAWRGADGINAFKNDLLISNSKKLSAYAVFAFLILLVLDLVVESGVNAFF